MKIFIKKINKYLKGKFFFLRGLKGKVDNVICTIIYELWTLVLKKLRFVLWVQRVCVWERKMKTIRSIEAQDGNKVFFFF